MPCPLPSRSRLAVVCHGRADLSRLEAAWPRLLARTGHEAPFYRLDFLRVWLDHFARDAPLHIVTARDAEGLRAALCLIERRRLFRGVPVRTLYGTAGVFTERYDLIARPDDAEAIDAIWRHVRDVLPWHVLELPEVAPFDRWGEGAAHNLLARAASDGPTGAWDSKHSRTVSLGTAAGQEPAGLSARFRRNLRSRRRRAESRGALTFEHVTAAGPALDAYLDEGFAVEASGWKGARGTAIACDARRRAFYTELARTAQAHGYLALSFLRCGGRAIAFHFALAAERRLYLLKVGMDEAFGDCAPGHLLVGEVLRELSTRGFEELDFLGPDMPWKREWAAGSRPHQWLYAFRDGALGRALHAAKFRLPSLWRGMGR